MSNKNEFISTKIIEKKFNEINAANAREGQVYYTKEDVDNFLSKTSLEIKSVEDYVFSVHHKNGELEKQVKKLEDDLRNAKANKGAGEGASTNSASTIDKIISYAEAEAAELKEKARQTSDNIIEQGRKQATDLVKKATVESQEIKTKASEYLESIEQYKKSMSHHQAEYNEDVRKRSQRIKEIALNLSEFADEVEKKAQLSFGPEFGKRTS